MVEVLPVVPPTESQILIGIVDRLIRVDVQLLGIPLRKKIAEPRKSGEPIP
jgi:hypothetical protein